jgi:hypothetical protein
MNDSCLFQKKKMNTCVRLMPLEDKKNMHAWKGFPIFKKKNQNKMIY